MQADIGDAGAMRALFADEQPDGSHPSRGRVARRPIDRRAGGVHSDERRRDVHAAAGEPSLLPRAARRDRAAAFRFVHVSTDEVFGSLGPTGAFVEDTPYAPRSPYAASKAAADHLVRAWFHTYGLPTITTNCSNNYGPYQFPEKLIPLAIQRALHGEPDSRLRSRRERARLAVRRRSRARAASPRYERGVPGETYNIGGRGERRNLEIVEAVCALLDELAPHPASPTGAR